MSRSVRRSALRQSLSYHRLRDAAVAQRIVASTGLAPPAHVYEFGAGDGLLTAALARCADRVTAIEIDRLLHQRLMQNVACFPHVQAIHGDFREVALPSRGPYSVVANLPFSLTATSLRLLVEAANPPSSAFLVVQREVAMTWALQGRGTLAATVAQLRFAFDVPLALRRRDFVPWPRVDSVVLAMHRRERPLLPDGEARRFAGFVARGYGGGRPTLSHNLRAVARERPLRAALDRAGIPPGAAPSGLGIEQWLALWRSLSALS